MTEILFKTPKSKQKNVSFSLQTTKATEYNTISVHQNVKDQIKEKVRTLMNWSFRNEIKKPKSKIKHDLLMRNDSNAIDTFSAILLYSQNMDEKNKKNKISINHMFLEELPGLKAERRQRLKKAQNPLQIIKTYIQKEDYHPTAQMMALMNKIVNYKSKIERNPKIDIDEILQNLYKMMNMCVDYNQLEFLTLVILLTADICYQFKDLNRSFYFYNQTKLAATYADLHRIKMDALIGMAKIAFDLKQTNESIIIFKKGLQFAWRNNSQDYELLIYDYLGKIFYSEGLAKQADYFHTRYSQGQLEKSTSAIKKISVQMLNQYHKRILSLEKQNLSSLFIQYLNLPISGFNKFPQLQSLRSQKYQNYDQEGFSPRKKNRKEKNFTYQQFPEVRQLLADTLSKDIQFQYEIPLPDLQSNFKSCQLYGRPRKELDFTQTTQFHRLIGDTKVQMKFEEIYKYPLDVKIQKRMKQKPNPYWWEDIVTETRKQRSQRLGTLRSFALKSHQSYHKYPQQRRRSQSLKLQKIKQSFNRTLLDFIDPKQ